MSQLQPGDLASAASLIGLAEAVLIHNLRLRSEINKFKVHELKEILRCLKSKPAFSHIEFRLNGRKEEMVQVLVDLFCRDADAQKNKSPPSAQLAPVIQQQRPVVLQQPDILARHANFNCLFLYTIFIIIIVIIIINIIIILLLLLLLLFVLYVHRVLFLCSS